MGHGHTAGSPLLGENIGVASARQLLQSWETFLGLSGKESSGGRIAAGPERAVAAARGVSSAALSAFSSRNKLEYLFCSACVGA